ncbi:MAG: peptidoglycan DD-metalloendopeptidase family protein [Microcystaceae cyanobacterium]
MKPSTSKAQAPWLKRSISLVGSLTLIGAGIGELSALATTQSLVIDATPPTAPNVSFEPPVSPAPKAPVSKPAVKKPVSKPIYKVSPKTSVAPKPQTKLAAPKVSVPKPKVQIARPQVTAPAPKVTIQGKNSYIDANRYGKSQVTPPSKVILTERNSGCQTVAQNGQLSQGSCGGSLKKPVSLATAKPDAPRTQKAPAPVARRQPTRSNYQPVARRASAPRVTRRQSSPSVGLPIDSRYVVGLQPIKRRGFNITLEPVAPYNRATSLYDQYSQAIAPAAQQTTDLLYPLPIIGQFTSAFGWRQHPIAKTRRFHNGTDIGAPMGTPVLATYEGEVVAADWAGGYGLMVTLRHLDGTQESRYAHLSEIFVQPGQWVEKGEVIGRLGSTGYSTGPHLHFEWRHKTEEGWVAVDAGLHLEFALDNLIRSMEYAQQLRGQEPLESPQG